LSPVKATKVAEVRRNHDGTPGATAEAERSRSAVDGMRAMGEGWRLEAGGWRLEVGRGDRAAVQALALQTPVSSLQPSPSIAKGAAIFTKNLGRFCGGIFCRKSCRSARMAT
jgi:hypothetical protein